MHNMLLLMGYVPQVEVKKSRRKGKLGEYGVCMDTVEKLGNFGLALPRGRHCTLHVGCSACCVGI